MAKVLPPQPTGAVWGQKVLPAGERSYSCVGRKFSVLRVGGGGDACAPFARRADVTVLVGTPMEQDLLLDETIMHSSRNCFDEC